MIASLRMPAKKAFLGTIYWPLSPKMSTSVCFHHRPFKRSPASLLSFHMLFSRKARTLRTHFCPEGKAVCRRARRCSSMRLRSSWQRSCRAGCVQVAFICACVSGRPQGLHLANVRCSWVPIVVTCIQIVLKVVAMCMLL